MTTQSSTAAAAAASVAVQPTRSNSMDEEGVGDGDDNVDDDDLLDLLGGGGGSEERSLSLRTTTTTTTTSSPLSSSSSSSSRKKNKLMIRRSLMILSLLTVLSFIITRIDQRWINDTTRSLNNTYFGLKVPSIRSSSSSSSSMMMMMGSINTYKNQTNANTTTVSAFSPSPPSQLSNSDNSSSEDNDNDNDNISTDNNNNNNKTMRIPPPPPPPLKAKTRIRGNLTLVIGLGGELGNHFYFVNRGIMLSRMAHEAASQIRQQQQQDDEHDFVFELQVTMMLQQQLQRSNVIPKGRNTETRIRRCFPGFQNISFHFGRSEEYNYLMEQQQKLPEWDFLTSNQNISDDLHSTNKQRMKSSMKIIVDQIYQNAIRRHQHPNITERRNGTTIRWLGDGLSGIDVSLPIINVKRFAMFSLEYEDELRHMYRMNEDDPYCCNVRVGPDETVFHFRNFVSEMPKRGIKLGFEELSPSKIANEVFRDLKSGDKVSIITRIKNEKVEEIQNNITLAHPGVSVQILTNNSGVQDFCLLKTAPKEIIGSAKSTFVSWAAFLGHQQRARLYYLDSERFRSRHQGDDAMFSEANELIPNSQTRIQYEVYRSEQMEELLKNNDPNEPSSKKIPEMKELEEIEKLISQYNT